MCISLQGVSTIICVRRIATRRIFNKQLNQTCANVFHTNTTMHSVIYHQDMSSSSSTPAQDSLRQATSASSRAVVSPPTNTNPTRYVWSLEAEEPVFMLYKGNALATAHPRGYTSSLSHTTWREMHEEQRKGGGKQDGERGEKRERRKQRGGKQRERERKR